MEGRESNFAVIGNPISHSLSPISFTKYMKILKGFNYSRVLLQDIKELKSLVDAFDIKGINVTAPFKKEVLQLVDEVNEEVEMLNVANTIIFEDKMVKAYNTDLIGVQKPLERRKISANDSVLILGAGGAAKSVILALEKIGVTKIAIANRSVDKCNKIALYHKVKIIAFDKLKVDRFDIIINTIPVGLSLFDSFKFKKSAIVFDANYNNKPLANIAYKYEVQYIDGIEWLIEQGTESYKLMTGVEEGEISISDKDKELVVQKSKRVALIGPMGSWKSSVGKLLSKQLGFEFFDIDNLIEDKEGVSITNIFKNKGEDYFRKLENKVLNDILKYDNIVLSTGGGIVKQDQNIDVLKEKSWNILLYASPEECFSRINIAKRPLLRGKDVLKVLKELFEQRRDKYFKTSDLIINTEKSTSIKIAEYLYEDYNKTFKI